MRRKAVDYEKRFLFDIKYEARLTSYVLDVMWHPKPEVPAWRHL